MSVLSAAVSQARERFTQAGLPDAAIEARILIGGLLGLSSTEVFTDGEPGVLSDDEQQIISSAIERRVGARAGTSHSRTARVLRP